MSGFVQKKTLALIIIIMIGLIFGGLLISGCSTDKTESPDTIFDIQDSIIDDQMIPLANVDLAFINSTFEIPIPNAPGFLKESNDQAFIDYSNKKDGYVTAGFIGNTDNMLRVLMLVPGGREYVYTLTPGISEVFPLANGDGQYIISIHEHIMDNIFKDLLSVTIDVELVNEFVPFIRPNQFIDYSKECPVTVKAIELSFENYKQIDLIKAIYTFVVENISYDFDLAETVGIGYKPDINRVLERGSGICLDIATLTTAMLRSQGIPSKLVFGYRYDPNLGNTYHAWVSVFSEEDGAVGDNIFFTGGTWNILDPTSATILGMSESGVTVGDGKIYHALYYY